MLDVGFRENFAVKCKMVDVGFRGNSVTVLLLYAENRAKYLEVRRECRIFAAEI